MPLPKPEKPEDLTTCGRPTKRLVRVVKPYKTESGFLERVLEDVIGRKNRDEA